MEWAQVLTIAGTNIAMFLSMVGLLLWFRSESREDWKVAREDWKVAREDWKHLDEKVDANHRETLCIVEAVRKESTSMIESIRQDIKDFHGRLCEIEAKRK